MPTLIRRCARCPRPAMRGRWRCVEHAREQQHESAVRRGSRHERGLGNDWARQSQAAVAAHVAAHGWLCPGDGIKRGPHPSRDLTGDHVVPRAQGGTAADGIIVRCRSCNARRGAGRSNDRSQSVPPRDLAAGTARAEPGFADLVTGLEDRFA